jgi:nucleoside-diphosphate-sugar epimerase
MHVLCTGAGGMIGRKLTAQLIKEGALGGRPISRLTLLDIEVPDVPAGARHRIATAALDLSMLGAAARAIADTPDVIFHLAAVVSGEAEADFEKGYAANCAATRGLLEAIRQVGDYRPKLVFASSIAVYGAPFPEAIPDDFIRAPLTSYGTQKAICELMLADCSRRGFLDGVGIRLPTAGEEAVLPVAESVRHWFASPRAAVAFLVHAAGLERDRLGPHINVTMPGFSCTVGEQIAALTRIAGPKVAARIRREPDALVERIVSGWPQNFHAHRAAELGFVAEKSFDEIIRAHIEDELGGTFVN